MEKKFELLIEELNMVAEKYDADCLFGIILNDKGKEESYISGGLIGNFSINEMRDLLIMCSETVEGAIKQIYENEAKDTRFEIKPTMH
jgi:hypothetical protein